MKLQILQDNLANALNTASRFASARAQLPILSNIHLEAKGNSLQISATNLEMSVSIKIGAQISEEGSIALPAKTFTEIIQNLKGDTVELASTNEQMEIKSGKFKSNLMGINALDFPKVPHVVQGNSTSIACEMFSNWLSKTLFAVSLDETRPILTGVLFILEKTKCRVVATDGFRLSLLDDECKSMLEAKFVVPRSVLVELSRHLGDGEVVLSFDSENNQVLFSLGDLLFASRVIQGVYPDYEKILPKESVINVFLDRSEFSDSLKLASVFARDSSNIAKLDVLNGKIVIKAESQTAGSQESSIEAKVEGGDLTISYNYKFIEDFLSSVKGNSIEIGFNEATTPGVFRDPLSKNYTHIIMPVKV